MNWGDWIYKKIIFLIMWLVVYFSPVYEYLIIIGILVFIDTALGSHIAQKRKRFTSRTFKRVVWKSGGYFIAISVAHLIEISFQMNLALQVTAGYITFTELVSIDENYFKITGKHIFKHIIQKFKQ